MRERDEDIDSFAVFPEPGVILLEALDGLHRLGVAWREQCREDLPLFVRKVRARGGAEVLDDDARDYPRVIVSTDPRQARQQRSETAQLDDGWSTAGIERIEAVQRDRLRRLGLGSGRVCRRTPP